jgi:CDP-paratose 2-epimerase
LYVDDLVDAFEAAAANIGTVAGSVFNIGGGPNNAVSVLDVLAFVEQLSGKRIRYRIADTRPGDQHFYVSDIRRACSQLRWRPRVDWRRGLAMLYEWVGQCGDELR